jgi:putative transposase
MQRKQYTGAFKAKVALDAIKGQRTIQELASGYGVHPNQITKWKKRLIDEAADLLSDGRKRHDQEVEEKSAELYEQIGKLQVELDWLQKKSGILRR